MDLSKLGITKPPWIVGELTEHPIMKDSIAIFEESKVPSKNAESIAITGLMDDYKKERLSRTYIDSQLMATAPEMLEALIMQMNLIANYHTMTITSTIISEINNKTKNVIEKATGKKWEEVEELLLLTKT